MKGQTLSLPGLLADFREAHRRHQHPTRKTSDNKALPQLGKFSTLHCFTGVNVKNRHSKAPTRTEMKMIMALHRARRAVIMTWKHSKKRSCVRRWERAKLRIHKVLNLTIVIQFVQLKRGKIEPNGTSSALSHSVPVRREFVMYNKGESQLRLWIIIESFQRREFFIFSSDVEWEQPSVPAGFRRSRHSGVGEKLPNRISRKTSETFSPRPCRSDSSFSFPSQFSPLGHAVWANRWKRLHAWSVFCRFWLNSRFYPQDLFLDFQYPFSALQAFSVALANVTQRLK